jgi:hypothetical protein
MLWIALAINAKHYRTGAAQEHQRNGRRRKGDPWHRDRCHTDENKPTSYGNGVGNKPLAE